MVRDVRPARQLAVAAAVLCGAVALALAGGGSAGAQACAGARVQQGQSGTWTLFAPPGFAGGPEILAYAVDPAKPADRYVTNGAEIRASHDGGCTWASSYTVADQGALRIEALGASGGRVLAALSAPRAASDAPGTIVLGDRELNDYARVTLVLRSADGGQAWAQSTLALPGVAGPVALGRQQPLAGYVSAGPDVYRTDDGGASLTRASPAAGTQELETTPAPLAIRTLVADPLDIDTVWATRDVGVVYRSTDGGQSWRTYGAAGEPGTGARGPALARPESAQQARVVFAEQPAGAAAVERFLVSEDGGGGFGQVPLGTVEGAVSSLVGGPGRRDLYVTTDDVGGVAPADVYAFSAKVNRLVRVDEFGLAPLLATAVSAAGVAHLRSTTRLVDYAPVADGAPEPPPRPAPPGSRPSRPGAGGGGGGQGGSGAGDAAVESALPTATIDPPGGDIVIPPGAPVDVPHRINVAGKGLPLDIFFLLDTSGSTEPYIDGLKDALARLIGEIPKLGIDARYGLGEYNESEGNSSGTRYERLADIGPAEPVLEELARISTRGGLEPGYTAVHQVVTGTGVESYNRPVAPGQQANWRPGAVRLIVQAADEPFWHDPAGATRDVAARALVAERVNLAAIQKAQVPARALDAVPDCGGALTPVGENTIVTPAQEAKLRCQFKDLAKVTGTVAPRGGVDCEGDGIQDIAEGDPFVCTLTQELLVQGNVPLEQPIRRLLTAFAGAPSVTLQTEGPVPVKVEITPGGDYGRVELDKLSKLPFGVRFSCAPAQYGQSFPVTLVAYIGDEPAGRATPRVVCQAPPVPAEVAPPPARVVDPTPAVVVPPPPIPLVPVAPVNPPPPARVPSPVQAAASAPAPAPSSAANAANATSSATQPAPGASAAAQEEQTVPPIALVTLDDVPGGAPQAEEGVVPRDHEFSRRGDGAQLPPELRFSANSGDDPELASAQALSGEDPGSPVWMAQMFGIAAVLFAAGALAQPRNRPSRRRAER